MPAISNFILSADHFRITEYALEYGLCDKQGCIVCAKIICGARTPDISIKGNNIEVRILQWMDLPVIYPLNQAHLLSIDKKKAFIDTNIPSLEELIRNLPAVK